MPLRTLYSKLQTPYFMKAELCTLAPGTPRLGAFDSILQLGSAIWSLQPLAGWLVPVGWCSAVRVPDDGRGPNAPFRFNALAYAGAKVLSINGRAAWPYMVWWAKNFAGTPLQRTVLYCTVLNSDSTLYCTVLYCTALYCTALLQSHDVTVQCCWM